MNTINGNFFITLKGVCYNLRTKYLHWVVQLNYFPETHQEFWKEKRDESWINPNEAVSSEYYLHWIAWRSFQKELKVIFNNLPTNKATAWTKLLETSKSICSISRMIVHCFSLWLQPFLTADSVYHGSLVFHQMIRLQCSYQRLSSLVCYQMSRPHFL